MINFIEKRTKDLKILEKNIDIKEVLSRKVVDTTVNKIIFRVKDNNENNIIWKEFVDNISNNNMLDRIIRTDIKMKSKFGKTYVGFDIWYNKIKIWIADNAPTNQSIRINGLEQYATLVNRTYSTYNGGAPVLKNQLLMTQNKISFLFLGGLGISQDKTKELNIINNSKNWKETKKSVIAGFIPLSWASISIPKYIEDQFRIGTHNHNYGVVPCVEMLNKDLIDNDSDGVEPPSVDKQSDIFYSDWYPAKNMIAFYNEFINFLREELQLDHTRVIGMFSNQDLNSINESSSIKNRIMSAYNNWKNSRISEEENQGEDNFLKKKLILKSIGSDSKIDIMQTTFRGIEHIQTLENLTTYIFKLCGYSWDENNGSVYENVTQTMNSSKGIYETTKSKISLFEKQWSDFFGRIAFAYFRRKTKGKFYNVDQAISEFKKNVEFKIISNVLQQENNDWKKIIELKSNGLISLKKAIKDINPELDNEEIQFEIENIDEEETKRNDFYLDDHNFEQNENPAYDNQGEIKENE